LAMFGSPLITTTLFSLIFLFLQGWISSL
jgi:hypothetical protein